jgi:hypothetical protein
MGKKTKPAHKPAREEVQTTRIKRTRKVAAPKTSPFQDFAQLIYDENMADLNTTDLTADSIDNSKNLKVTTGVLEVFARCRARLDLLKKAGDVFGYPDYDFDAADFMDEQYKRIEAKVRKTLTALAEQLTPENLTTRVLDILKVKAPEVLAENAKRSLNQ